MKARVNFIGKYLTIMALVLFAVIAVGRISVQAGEGKTVRVSTAKELKKAIGNSKVGTIILRTQAYIDVTVKANKAAKEKFLIIDAPYANVTNKAVFAGIEIQDVKKYTESASGNKISITGYMDNQLDGFIVSKNKKVASLTLSHFYYKPGYILRKGAKLSELNIVMTDKDNVPYEVSLNSKNRSGEMTLEFDFGIIVKETFSFSIDKNGRLSNTACSGDGVEGAYEYQYRYDANGNLLAISGWEDVGEGGFDTYSYTKDHLMKSSLGEMWHQESEYLYDGNWNLVHIDTLNAYTMDGVTEYEKCTEEYEYDEKERVVYYRKDNLERGYFWEYSYEYDSKGFLIKQYNNESGALSETINTYNKAGDLIKTTIVSEGNTEIIECKYDKLGELID